MRPRLTRAAEEAMEARWKLQHRAVELLGLVVAEWKSDPMSVQCFDLRIVEEAKQVVAGLEKTSFF